MKEIGNKYTLWALDDPLYINKGNMTSHPKPAVFVASYPVKTSSIYI